MYGVAKRDEYISTGALRRFITTDERCSVVDAAISALNIAIAAPDATFIANNYTATIAKEYYAIALLYMFATAFVAHRTDLYFETHKKLAPLLKDMVLQKWEWAQFRDVARLVFAEIDNFLADRPHNVGEITDGWNYCLRDVISIFQN